MNGLILITSIGGFAGICFLWMVKTLYTVHAEIKLLRYAIFGKAIEGTKTLHSIPLVEGINLLIERVDHLEDTFRDCVPTTVARIKEV